MLILKLFLEMILLLFQQLLDVVIFLNYEHYIDVSSLSDEQIKEAIEKYTIFGRVSPKQKQLMVNALQENNHTVAMTGDGVNDVLALKAADCSIAMASGSDAAKSASHIVLLKNNFNAMPHTLMKEDVSLIILLLLHQCI